MKTIIVSPSSTTMKSQQQQQQSSSSFVNDDYEYLIKDTDLITTCQVCNEKNFSFQNYNNFYCLIFIIGSVRGK